MKVIARSLYSRQADFARLGQSASNESHSPITATKSASISVPKSTKSILVVGDAAVSGPNQVRDSLSEITTGSITVSSSLPSTPTADVVVLHPSGSLTTADRAKITGFLSTGKAVVFIANSVTKVAGSNISTIGGILAGATSTDQNGVLTKVFRSEDGMIPLSITLRGLSVRGDYEYFLHSVAASADRLVATSGGVDTGAMAYKVPTGGRTGFVGHDGVGSDEGSLRYYAALQMIVRWCMDGA